MIDKPDDVPQDIWKDAVDVAENLPSRVRSENRKFAAIVIASLLVAERNGATPSRESSDELAALAARYLGMEVTDFALHTNSVDPRDPNLVKTFEEIKRLAGSVVSQARGDK